MNPLLVPVGISSRHIHIERHILKALFGEEYRLTSLKPVSQPGEFASRERIEIIGPKGALSLRVMGPVAEATQVEISLSDSFALGIHVPIRVSGDLSGTPGALLKGPRGEYQLEKGIIVASRHLHLSTEEAKQFGIKNGDIIDVRSQGHRAVTFHNVLCRVSDHYSLDFHLDLDEANAAGLENGMLLEIKL